LIPTHAQSGSVLTLDNSLLVSQPDNAAEQALEIVETLVRGNAADLIVVDSVAFVPQAEIEG